MDDTATHTINPAIFDANLASLWAVLPASAEVVAAAPGPLSLTLATGRDGSPTFAWSDDAGVPRWLGRTSMPSISGPALVDSFEPGPGNVLLFGLGQGAEAWHLLDRMAAHQAVLIIEPSAWTVAAAFRLHDFSEALRRQRLLIFTDEDPWASCRDFLLAHDGFLVPDRILAWPWFEPHEVARVTNRLSEIQTEIARHRVDAPGAQSAPPPGDPHDFAMAIVSNVPDARVHRLARQLSHAAAQLGWRHCCCVLDTPAGVHPRAVERAVREITPNRFVLIDMLPDSFQALPPDASVTIVCSHPLPLSDDWLGRIPPSASLAVRSDSQRQG
ncbi:MAG: hypothetical protein ACE5EC_09075, partial [Phycisphaerae bacterium]